MHGNVCRAATCTTTSGVSDNLAESRHRLEQEEKLLETLLASNIAAAILLSVEHNNTVRNWLKNASIPVMEIGAIRTDPIDMNIGIDNVAAMFELTDMLVQRGYQNIGLLCANQNSGSFSSIYRDGIKLCYAIICLPTVLLTLLCHRFFHRSITITGIFTRMAGTGCPGMCVR